MAGLSIFRPPLSGAGAAVLTLAGDWFVPLLKDGLRPTRDLAAPPSMRVAGDLDRRPEFSPASRRRGWFLFTPLPIWSLLWTTLTDPPFLLAGDCSDLLAGDFPTGLPAKSPVKERYFCILAGDLLTLWRFSSSVNVVVDTLSLKLQTSETSEISSPLLMVATANASSS